MAAILSRLECVKNPTYVNYVGWFVGKLADDDWRDLLRIYSTMLKPIPNLQQKLNGQPLLRLIKKQTRDAL